MGFETLHYLANEDDKDTLTNNVIYNQSRRMDLKMKQIKKNSTLFNSFPDSILFKMIDEPLLYHAHDWVISTDTYEKREPLKNFYNILATDEHDGTEFVVAVEAKDYPVSGVMFHPETQNRHIVGQCDSSMFGKVNNLTTDAINFYFS